MTLRLHLRPVPLVVAACLVSVGCYGDVELEACTISETYCDDAEHTAGPGSSSAAVTDGSASPATTTAAGSDAGATDTGATGTGGDIGTGETSGDEAGLPIDLPPAVWDLVCDPEIAAEVGPYQCTYQVSPDALEADLLDDGVVVATGPAGAPLVFPVTSAPHNNPGSELTVVVRDAANQTAQTSIYHPAVLLDPGSKVWTTQEPNDGPSSIARGVALQAGYVITAGSHLSNGKLVGTLRRYDKAGQYIASAEGWTRTHTDWTAYPELKTAALTLMGVAVDAEQNIITVGTAYINDEPRMYVARFHADGTLHWEVLGEVPTEARAVGVQPDGTIWVAGDVRTSVGPERWDLAVWVYGPDKQAHGQDIYNDPTDFSSSAANAATPSRSCPAAASSSRARARSTSMTATHHVPGAWRSCTRARASGSASGPRPATRCSATRSSRPSPPTPASHSAATRRRSERSGPEAADPRALARRGAGGGEGAAARGHARRGYLQRVGYNREGATIVGATVSELGQGNNQWIFAVRDAALPRVDYMKRDGQDSGDDRVLALACDYMCAWAGMEEVDGAVKWIAGLRRG
jgi:hypothetical protein